MEHRGRFDPAVILQSPTSLCCSYINNASDLSEEKKKRKNAMTDAEVISLTPFLQPQLKTDV